MKVKPTLPLVIEIINSSSDSYSCMEILSLSRFKKMGLKYKDHTNMSLRIKNFDFSYEELMEFLETNEIKVNKTYFQSTNIYQIFELSQYKRLDCKINIMPDFEIKESNYGVMMFKHQEFTLDKDSSFVVQNIFPSSKLTIYMY